MHNCIINTKIHYKYIKYIYLLVCALKKKIIKGYGPKIFKNVRSKTGLFRYSFSARFKQ